MHEPFVVIYTHICIYKCVEIFRESGIRDPFLFGFSVSSRSNEKSRIEFRHLRFHRIPFPRGMSLAAEIDRPDDDSLRFFLDYYYVLSCPLSRYKVVLFHADTQQDIIGFCIIDPSIRLEPSFSSLFRPRCDSAPRFKGNDGNSIDVHFSNHDYISLHKPSTFDWTPYSVSWVSR